MAKMSIIDEAHMSTRAIRSGFSITFGEAGNGASFQVNGWSEPEGGFTWSVGEASQLLLPKLSLNSDWIMTLRGSPLRLVGPEGRRLEVLLDGIAVACFWVDRTFCKTVRLRSINLPRRPSTITFRQPDHRSPKSFGGLDTRELAFQWESIELAPAAKCLTKSAKHVPFPSGEMVAAWLKTRATSYGITADTLTALKILPADDNGSALTFLFLQRLRLREYKSLSFVLTKWLGGYKFTIQPQDSWDADPTLLICDLKASGDAVTLQFSFPISWTDGLRTAAELPMLIWHWLATIPLLTAYCDTQRNLGRLILNLGDEAHARGLAFCGRTSESVFIPDPYFLGSNAYSQTQTAFHNARPFSARRPMALWRGSSTGTRDGESVGTLPRVALCKLASQSTASAFIDAGLTAIVQTSHEEQELLCKAGFLKDRVSVADFANWQFQIDIDGNTNSWPGLFGKLLSGSVVLKVNSPGGWRQWYYDRLEPGKHFMPVQSDLSDLPSKIKYLIYNRDLAEEIANNGQNFAKSMTYENEAQLSFNHIEDCILEERRHTG